MTEHNRRQFSPPVLGGVSLLIIFAVMCLTVFALLSLSTAGAHRRLSDSAAQSIHDYYAAECEAQTVLARLRAGEIPTGVVFDGDICYYTCRISDSRTLEVEVRLDGSKFDILRWQEIVDGNWESDDNLNLWSGD